MARVWLLLTWLLLETSGAAAPQVPDTLRTELDGLRAWAREASQHIGTTLAAADPEFPGVRQFGTVLSASEDREIGSVAAVTDSSSAYWRARLEMARENPSVLVGRVLLHLRSGEIDRAARLMPILPGCPMYETYATICYRELAQKLPHYTEARQRAIESGIAAFDAGDHVSAMACYDAVLAADSLCAGAWHEVFLTRGLPQDESTQAEYRRRVYGADPLYAMGMTVTTGTQAFKLGRRIELATLFSDREKAHDDWLTYATIALDVGEYGFGAEFFWTIFSCGPERTRDAALDGFLYCLNRLGVEGIAENFVGDNQARLERVERGYRERLEGSIYYQAMERKE